MFTLIIIRVGISETAGDSSSKGHAISHDSRITAAPAHGPHNSQHYPMRPLAINVSVSRTHDRSSLDGYERKDVVHVKQDLGDLESGSITP